MVTKDSTNEDNGEEEGVSISLSHADPEALVYLNETLAFGDLAKFMADRLVDER